MPPGNIWQYLKSFLVVMAVGEGVPWHEVGGDQGCCQHPIIYRTIPTMQNDQVPKINIATVENPCPEDQGSICTEAAINSADITAYKEESPWSECCLSTATGSGGSLLAEVAVTGMMERRGVGLIGLWKPMPSPNSCKAELRRVMKS